MDQPPSTPSVSLTQRGQLDREEIKATIKVFVRVRPENDIEKIGGQYRRVVDVIDSHALLFDRSPDILSASFNRMSVQPMQPKRRCKNAQFAFDSVFPENASQEEVYSQSADKLIDSVLGGYNATVFAYGATGSGKTHTMIGNQKFGPGIMGLAMKELCEKIHQDSESSYELSVSCLEVYNETIRYLLVELLIYNLSDLFVENSPVLEIKERKDQGFIVPGLSAKTPKTWEEVNEMLQNANSHRTQAATNANATSSRSHAVFQITVLKKPNCGSKATAGKLSLIDLAGSESASRNQNKGERLQEGSHINKSLLALSSCINALGCGQAFVPYRNSKLTQLLKDSLCGNCLTIMIANVSPSSCSMDDTWNTLIYAKKTKNIKLTVSRNVIENPEVVHYQLVIARLEGKLAQYQEQQARLEALLSANEVASTQQIPKAQLDAVDLELRKALYELEATRSELQNEREEYDKIIGEKDAEIQMVSEAIAEAVVAQKSAETERDCFDSRLAESEYALESIKKQMQNIRVESTHELTESARVNSDMATSLDLMETKLDEMRKELEAAHHEIKAEREHSYNLCAELSKETTEIYEISSSLEQTQAMQIAAEMERDAAQEQFAVLALQMQHEKEQRLEEELAKTKQLEALSSQHSELITSFKTVQAERESLYSQLLEMNQVKIELEDTRTQAEMVAYSLKVIAEENAMLSNKLKDAELQRAATEAANQQLRNDLENAHRQLDVYTKLHEAHKATNSELAQALKQAEAAKNIIEAKLEEAEACVISLRKEKDTALNEKQAQAQNVTPTTQELGSSSKFPIILSDEQPLPQALPTLPQFPVNEEFFQDPVVPVVTKERKRSSRKNSKIQGKENENLGKERRASRVLPPRNASRMMLTLQRNSIGSYMVKTSQPVWK